MPEDWLARLRQPPPHPGMVFAEMIREQHPGISQAEAARRIGMSPYNWGQIELGRRPVTTETAVKLEQLTGVSAEFWCRLQMHYDLWKAIQAEKRGEIKIAGEPFSNKYCKDGRCNGILVLQPPTGPTSPIVWACTKCKKRYHSRTSEGRTDLFEIKNDE